MIFFHALKDPLLRLSFVCILLMGPAVASITPFQSVIAIERFGFSNAAYALVVTAGALFSVVASVVVGIVVDQTQRYRAILLACIGVGAFGGFLMALWPTPAGFVLLHLVLFPIGATTFAQYFALAAVAADRNPRLDRDAGLSLVRAGFSGTFAITPPLWALVFASGVDLLAVYWAAAVGNLLVLLVVYVMWPKDMGAQGAGSGLTFRQALGELTARTVLVRLGLITVVTSVNGLYTILLGLLVVTQLGGKESDLGLFSGGVAMIELPVMLGAALLLRRFSRVSVVLAGAAIYAASFAALAVVPTMAAAWWLMLPFGIGAGIILSVPVGYIQSLVEHRPGAGSSLITMSHFGGMLLGAGLFAGFAGTLGYSGVAVLGAALSLSAALLLFVLEGGRLRPRLA